MFCIFLSNYIRNVVSHLSSNHASNHVNVDPSQITSPLAAFTYDNVIEVRK